MNKRQKSIRNLTYSLLSQTITICFGLILPRMWIVSYGSEVNGLLGSLNQFLIYLSLFEAGVGTATLQALYKPVGESDWGGINGILSATHRYYRKIGLLYFVGLCLLSILYPLLIDSTLSYGTILGAVFFSGIGNVFLFCFQGKYIYFLNADGKSYVTANLNTIIYVLISISKVVLISLSVNIVIVLASSFLIQCLQVGYICHYMKKYPKLDLHVQPNYEAIGHKNFVLIHQISSLIFQNTDVIILTIFCDLEVVSVYTIFKLITTHLETFLEIPLNSISFALGQTYHTDKAKYIQQIDLVESFNSSLVYAIFSVALYLFIPFMRLYTDGVSDVFYTDSRLAFLFVLVAILNKSRTPMNVTINIAGHFRNTVSRAVLEMGINLVVSLICVYFWGIYGVLAGTVVALLYRTNDMIIYANRKILLRSPLKTYFIYFINITLFILTQIVFRVLLNSNMIDSYFMFLGTGIICTVIAVTVIVGGQLLFFARCREFAINFLHKFVNKITKKEK